MDIALRSRSFQLGPLSSEHKDGMLFVSRIRQGLGRISIDRLSDYSRWYWKNHIRPHFFQEEKILLPYMEPNHPWARQLQDEHSYIRDLIISVDQHPDKYSFMALCDLLERHIGFEEMQLFGFLEEKLPEEELNKVYQQLKDHPVLEGEWSDVFWEAD